MRERNAYLYVHRFTEEAFERLANALGQAGFSLYQPDTGIVTAIRTEHDIESDDDLIGDHMPVAKDWLVQRIHDRVATSLDWWASDWTTVFCSFLFDQPIDELLIGLNGIVGDQIEQPVFDALLSVFKDEVKHENAVGLIYDPEGVTEDDDWHAFFKDPAEAPEQLPTLIAARQDIIARLAPPANYTQAEFNGFSILAEQTV